MKSSGNKLMMAGAVLAVLLVVASVAFQMVTERNLRAAVDRLKNSEVFQRYKQTHREENQAGSGTLDYRKGDIVWRGVPKNEK